MTRLYSKVILVLIITLLSSPETVQAQAENVQPDIASSPISVCFERWRPFSFVDQDGIAKGEEIDLIKAAARTLNRTVQFSELPFKRCVANVKFGSTDFSLHVDKTDGLAIFSNTTTFWQLSLAVSAARFQTLDGFKAISTPRIMLATEYPYPKAVYRKLEALDARLVRRSYYEENDEHAKTFFDILTTKRVDAMLVDKQWAQHMIDKFNLPVNLLAQDFHSEPQYIGYRHSNASLAQQLEAALLALPQNVRTTIKDRYKYK
ncbi:transporter substrate-binding domain-containing protein [Pseudoalteromonas sp. R3]|uniref:substrate-binding periplasmic protein n=1 Tax=Pseudoalteromonas sp. R3 TaxID=1709477 RepID=UPI0006B46F21|nr:transporter substrate-binding domain-containing protein [Pseudoalteromonas sp. R3]AZZ95656.1 transporter substrate-binding domain-containing protein [Pseudoalteromonas sp. R3]